MVLDYALRPLLSFLHAVVLPTGVFAATEEFGSDSGLDGRIDRAAGELAGQLTSVDGVAGFTQEDGRSGASGRPQDNFDADFRVPSGGFAALLSGHTGR
jgi:FMN reductase